MLRSTGRLILRAHGARVAPLIPRNPPGTLHSLQPSKLLVRSVPAVGILNVRSYWWSKSSIADTKTTTTPIPESSTVPASSSSEALQSTSSAFPDAIHTTAASSDLDSAPDTLATVPPTDSLPFPSDMAEVANLIPPLQYGDFAALGLIGWSPAGLATWSFELLQVTTGMPWFYAIIAGTLMWRLPLIPLAISGVRNSARIRPYMSEMKDIDEKALTADYATKMELMLQKRSIMDRSGFKLGTSTIVALSQFVVQVSLFLAVRNITTLPVEQLHNSGFPYLLDLTVPDSSYILPALSVVLGNTSITLAKKDLETTRQLHTMNVLRLASVAFSLFMTWMPSGLWVSIVTGLAMTVLQGALLRNPFLRRKLSIPPVADSITKVTMMETMAAIRKDIEDRLGSTVSSPISSPAGKPMRAKNPRISIRG